MSKGRPFLSSLEGHNDPNHSFDQPNSDYIEQCANDHAVLDLIDDIEIGLVIVLPLDVDETCENSHHIGRCSNVGFVVELIHKLRLRGEFGVGNGVPPVVDHDQYEGSNH